MNNARLFFEAGSTKKELSSVLREVQEYISGKYASLISDKSDEQKEQIESYISKYLIDYSLGVEGYDFEKVTIYDNRHG